MLIPRTSTHTTPGGVRPSKEIVSPSSGHSVPMLVPDGSTGSVILARALWGLHENPRRPAGASGNETRARCSLHLGTE